MEIAHAILYGFFLLAIWLAGLLFVAAVVWTVLRMVGATRNRRAAILGIVPFLVAYIRTLTLLQQPVLLLTMLLAAGHLAKGEAIALPPVASSARTYGEYLFCFSFVIITGVFVPYTYGISILRAEQESDPSAIAALSAVRLHGGILVGVIITWVRGPYCIFAGLLIIGYVALMLWLTSRAVALRRQDKAIEVVATNARSKGERLFVLVSDVHTTDRPDRIPTGGGKAGISELGELAQAIQSGSITTPLVVVSGDLVDHGHAQEWQLALKPLQEIRESGTRVVLAPGNHDVLPSYTPFGLAWAAMRRGILSPVIEGVLMRRYLDAAIAMEPELLTCTGIKLADFLRELDSPWEKLCARWDDARAEAAAAVDLPPDSRHAKAISRYRRVRPEAAAKLEARFVASAAKIYPQVPASYWQRNLYVISPHSVAEFFQHDTWIGCWYDPYPLRIVLADRELEVLIVNSNPPQPRLAQSALGQCGKDQLDRLESLMSDSQARTLLVIHHHALGRWKGDGFAYARWGSLAHDWEEAERLFDLLRASATPNRQVFLCMGHIHESSRFAFVQASTKDSSKADGFWYLESAALGEPGGRTLLAGVRDEQGRTQPTTIPLQFTAGS